MNFHLSFPFTLLLAGSLAQAADVQLLNQIGDDQRYERLSLSIDGKPAGRLDVGRATSLPEAQIKLPVEPNRLFWRYSVKGLSQPLKGQRQSLQGGGVLVLNQAVHSRLSGPDALRQLPDRLTALFAQLPQSEPFTGYKVHTSPPASAAVIAAAEKRLGVTLPAFYKAVVQSRGAWRFGNATHTIVELLPPQRLQSATRWLQEKPEWPSATGAKRLKALGRDVVFMVSGSASGEYASAGTPWLWRFGTATPCKDGNPSWTEGMIHYEDFLIEDSDPYTDFFEDRGSCQSIDDRLSYSAQSDLIESLSSLEVSFVSNERPASLERDDESQGNSVKVFFRSHGL
ncbi:hypothetical protein [Chitinimonas lacunae]|uniref:Knr4/Smi1-like domain-containing protein n=1 Tax=Chitinimonas lacunae TaxID=1963018 RepID=A0ABV8MTL0_9NEIS